MEIFFTDDDLSLSNRLLDNIMLRNQEGAEVRLFINTVADSSVTSLLISLIQLHPGGDPIHVDECRR